MERLFVFADFNWLGKAELVGELCYEKLHGSESYAFKFDENWLKVHAGSLATLLHIPAREIDMIKESLSLTYNIMKHQTYLLHYIMGYSAVSIMSMMV